MREQVKNLVRPPLAEAIFKLRKSRRQTQIEVSKELGVYQSAIVRWERGIDMPPTKALLMLSEMAPESEKQWWRDQASARVGFDLEGAEVPHPPPSQKEKEDLYAQIKVYKSAGAGAFRSVDEMPDHTVMFPRAWLPSRQKMVGLLVHGNSMSPLIEDGFIVIADLTRNTKTLALNHIVAASDGYGVAIRYLVEIGGSLWLQPHNMNVENRAVPVGRDMRIIGVVVKWIGQPKAGK
jgi:SOS-response transcriptional repressor LexA